MMLMYNIYMMCLVTSLFFLLDNNNNDQDIDVMVTIQMMKINIVGNNDG